MKNVVIGMLAHVDAGKTTLSEAMLYLSGSIKNLGRVDKGNAFLDTHTLEKERGITIFSKQAEIILKNTKLTIIDTPGHIDFVAETERTLQVLDYAALIVSAADGLQGHTRMLWKMLEKYHIPTFLFINKMDQQGADKKSVIRELKTQLSENCIDFGQENKMEFYEEIAVSDEDILEVFLEKKCISSQEISDLVMKRKIFPCHFGAALQLEGIAELLQSIDEYTNEKNYPKEFGAKVYKISRDSKGSRLTHMKITGGTLKVRAAVTGNREKITQIRVYSGEKYDSLESIEAGKICAVTGLNETYAGEGLGSVADTGKAMAVPVLVYKLILPEACNAADVFPKIKQLMEEDPALQMRWNDKLGEIQVQVMGEIQLEILKKLILERFEILVDFGTGNIVYKETITNIAEGVGHFEPLRHYAEVHLMIEPNENGKGIFIESICSEDILDKNWQMLILTYLQEQTHKGVLTGSELTDIKITLTAGRAHNKHTVGGDFQEATGRALRQGLMEAQSQLLEPYYSFRLEVPEKTVGRAISDIEKMYGKFEGPEIIGEAALLTGYAPVACMQEYHKEVLAYTKGNGRLSCTLKGYEPCHNEETIIKEKNYNPEADIDAPCGSVFCAHGAGFYVGWNQVKDYMHIESQMPKNKIISNQDEVLQKNVYEEERSIGEAEIEEIINRTFYANRHNEFIAHKGIKNGNRQKSKKIEIPSVTRVYKPSPSKKKYLLVDGYNIIYAWEELAELAEENMAAARDKLQDILCNYQAIKKCALIIVFDAYRVKGSQARVFSYHDIQVVYTKEAETADQYIEKYAHENQKKYDITVATSDGLEQIIIRGAGSMLLSARELKIEVEEANLKIQEVYADTRIGEERPRLLDEFLELNELPLEEV